MPLRLLNKEGRPRVAARGKMIAEGGGEKRNMGKGREREYKKEKHVQGDRHKKGRGSNFLGGERDLWGGKNFERGGGGWSNKLLKVHIGEGLYPPPGGQEGVRGKKKGDIPWDDGNGGHRGGTGGRKRAGGVRGGGGGP